MTLKSVILGCVLTQLMASGCGNHSYQEGHKTNAEQVAPQGKIQATGKTFEAKKKTKDTTEIQKAKYISAGLKEEYIDLANILDAHHDQQLAESIEDVSIRLENTDSKTDFPKILNVQVQIQNKNTNAITRAVFKMPLALKNQYPASEYVTEEKDKTNGRREQYEAIAKCLDEKCSKIELRIRDKNQKISGEAGLVYKISRPKLEAIRPTGSDVIPHPHLRQIEEAAKDGTIEQHSFTVVGGSSHTRVSISDRSKKIAFEFDTPVIDTTEANPSLTNAKFADGTPSNSELMGVDPDTGDLVMSVNIPDNDNSEMLLKIEETEKFDETKKAPEINPEAKEISKGLFPTLSKGVPQKQSFRFASLSADPQIKIDRTIKNRINLAIPNTPFVSPYIIKVFESLGMSPEFAYIMLIETDYLIAKDRALFNSNIVTQANKAGTALGPWQIVNGTAKFIRDLTGVNFNATKVSGTGNNRTWNQNDDRTYLVQSTYMAASYLKYIIEEYNLHTEPILAVVGYNRGEKYAQVVAQNFLKKYKRYGSGLDFRMIRKYNMISTDYIHKFLGFREVGQNPEKYGLSPVKELSPRSDIPKLSRKNGPVPPNFFD